MMQFENNHQLNTQLQSTRWIVDARWYYAFLAYLLSVASLENIADVPSILIATAVLAIVLIANIFFLVFLKKIDTDHIDEQKLRRLNFMHVSLDLVFFLFMLLFVGMGINTPAVAFFFIPIIVSMILFGFQGSVIIASIVGLLVFLTELLHLGIIGSIFGGNNPDISIRLLSIEMTKVGVLFLIYLLTGFFGGYISRVIKARDTLLFQQITREESHVKRLEELTVEFDKSAKLLVRRDLELSGANEKLTQLDRMKSEIISIVAHQLRTPLSAIKWTLKILLDEDAGKITPEQKDLLSKGFESNERMINLINDMLAVDRLESGKIKYSFIPVQIDDLVQDLIRNLLPLATIKNIRVELSLPEKPLDKIKVDPDKIRDVFQNLIDNGIKYARQDGLISVGLTMDGDQLHFWVKDNGIGIPDDEREKIFSRFFRAKNAIRTQTDGSGLGLFIAQSIIKRHGGKIWFESVHDVGTVFHVLLPFNP